MRVIHSGEILEVQGGYGEWFYNVVEIFVASLYDSAYYHSYHYKDDDDEYYQEHYHGRVWSG